MPNTFELAGANSGRPTPERPIWTAYFTTGLYTNRNLLRSSSPYIYDKFGYANNDAFVSGSNIAISNRLTPIRRPGNSVYNSNTFTDVDSFYSFKLSSPTQEDIIVIVDTPSYVYDGTGPSAQDLIFTKSAGAGQAFYQGVGNTLFFGDNVDQKKWVQTLTTWQASSVYSVSSNGFVTPNTFLIDPNGDIEQLVSTIVPIATVATDNSVPQNVTITYAGGTNLTTVVFDTLTGAFSGATTATWLNGQDATITNVTSNSVTFSTNITGHASYGPTSDTGLFTVLQGGNPVTAATEPTWNGTLLGTTKDNTALWANRGNPLENWGIAAPTTAPTWTKEGSGGIAWQANTFYSNPQVVVDSNGNLQQVTTAGKSGSTTPTWATIDGHTTTDGTVTWTQLETGAELLWAANTSYTSAKPFIVANASGTSCLFELQTNTTYPVFKLVGGAYVTSQFYTHNHAFAGQCELRNPVDGGNNPGSGTYPLITSATGNSILYNPPQYNGTTDPNVQPIQQATINGAGAITGYTTPWSGATQNYNMIVLATITVPAAGQYTFTINHDDGMFWGIGQGTTSAQTPSTVSGPNNCPAPQATLTALQGYQVTGANNVSGNNNDTYVVNFPAADSYPIEIDYCQSQTEQQLVFYCNGQTPVPGAPITGATEPIWPAWSSSYSFAPAYPSVQETNNSGNGKGPIQWNNIGPASDFSWHKTTNFYTTANSTIIDPNNNIQGPYEAGVTGSTASSEPTFATGINQLTKDNPHLTWINEGPSTAPPSGTISTFNGGWTYYVALVNTLTNTVSNASPASTATGNFIGLTGIQITGGLPTSIDPQVDYVAIFRTEDGGATPFLIPGTGNTVYTVPLAEYQADGYEDTTLDSGLNILLEAAIEGQNTPPGVGAINLAYHLNRIFFSIGNVVYWTSGPDTPIGNGVEGVSPANNATFPSLVKRLVPTSQGLFVYTISDIYLITGNGTASSPLFPLPYLPGKGIRSYNGLDVNGTLAYVFSQNAILTVDPASGFNDIGFNIGDQFSNTAQWNGANVYVAWHQFGEDSGLFVADGSTGFYRCNVAPAPEVGSVIWDTFATIVGGVGAIASIETTPGVKQLLLGPTGSGPILARDLTTNADNGSSYSANFVLGSVVLAEPGTFADVSFITTDSIAVGTRPSVAVLMDEISGVFDPIQITSPDPTKLEPSESLYSDRYDLLTAQNGTPAICRHMQIQVSYPAEDQPSELLSLTIFGGPKKDA